jgi:hypothetical protein
MRYGKNFSELGVMQKRALRAGPLRVMAVLGTAIYVFSVPPKEVVDGRNKSGHDE